MIAVAVFVILQVKNIKQTCKGVTSVNIMLNCPTRISMKMIDPFLGKVIKCFIVSHHQSDYPSIADTRNRLLSTFFDWKILNFAIADLSSESQVGYALLRLKLKIGKAKFWQL